MDENQNTQTDPNVREALKKFPPFLDEPEQAEQSTASENQTTETEREVQTEESTPTIETENPRTAENFEKLKQSNQELKKQLEQEKRKNLLESLRPDPQPLPQYQQPQPQAQTNLYPALNQQQVNSVVSRLVDENGYVDPEVLRSELNRANLAEERAKRAEMIAMNAVKRVQDMEESAEMQRVHAAFPDLNPNGDSFNELYFDSVQSEVYRELTTKGTADVMAIAKKYATAFTSKKEDQTSVKKQINAISPKPTPQQSSDDKSDLMRRIRNGEKGVLGAYLKQIGQ